MAQLSEANARLARIRTLPDKYLNDLAEAMAESQREVGRRIRDARDEKGWKQKDLARAVHVEPTTVSRWERGASAPDLPMLERIAAELGKPLPYFVSDSRTPAAALDEKAVRQMVREEVQGALEPIEQLLQHLLGQAPPESNADDPVRL
jgi:transcriptional regulator with XRE-family HTH domain